MLSADRIDGWKNHFMRMERWQARAVNALDVLPDTDFHDALDVALAYFVWSHSLRDWLLKDGVVNENILNDCLGKEPAWPIVRDLANRSRHLKLTRNPTDADWAVLREYVPLSKNLKEREKHRIILIYDGKKHRLLEVVGAAGTISRRVLSDVGLRENP